MGQLVLARYRVPFITNQGADMLFVVKFSGTAEGQRFMQAENEDDALAKFSSEWTQHGDELPSSFWISESWLQS